MLFLLLQQLFGVQTAAQIRQTMFDIAAEAKLDATSWQDGSWQRTLVEIISAVYGLGLYGASQIASGAVNDTAEGPWLWLLSDSDYDNQVVRAVATQGEFVLTCSASAGPHTITADALVVETEDGIRYRNKAGGTLASGGTLTVTWEAEIGGTAGNIPPNATLWLDVSTPLAGVTVTNPELVGETTWITRPGTDVEDDETLRARNVAKWTDLAVPPGEAYEQFAQEADSSVTRVYVDPDDPRGPGTIDVYLAGDSGPVVAGTITAVDDYLRGVTDGYDRVSTTDDLAVYSATQATITLIMSVYLFKQYDTTDTRDAIDAAVADYFKALPIGGLILEEGGDGAVRLAGLAGVLTPIAGVQNVDFPSVAADPPLAPAEVAVPSITINYYPI